MDELTPAIITQAVALSETIQRASRPHALEAAVTQFTRLLATVPDYAACEFSTDSIGLLGRLAESVIARIERRVGAGDDSGAVQLVLVEAVYDIRRALEEIDRWHRHYAGQTS